MSIKIKLPDGTEVTCDTPEEANKFLSGKTTKCAHGPKYCYQPNEPTDTHCSACGNHHHGMC